MTCQLSFDRSSFSLLLWGNESFWLESWKGRKEDEFMTGKNAISSCWLSTNQRPFYIPMKKKERATQTQLSSWLSCAHKDEGWKSSASDEKGFSDAERWCYDTPRATCRGKIEFPFNSSFSSLQNVVKFSLFHWYRCLSRSRSHPFFLFSFKAPSIKSFSAYYQESLTWDRHTQKT